MPSARCWTEPTRWTPFSLRHDGEPEVTQRPEHGCLAGHALHPFREGSGRAQRAFFAQLARSAGFRLAWQHLDAARNVETSAAIMRGDPEPMQLHQGSALTTRDLPEACRRLTVISYVTAPGLAVLSRAG
jgi:hypothetical protein